MMVMWMALMCDMVRRRRRGGGVATDRRMGIPTWRFRTSPKNYWNDE